MSLQIHIRKRQYGYSASVVCVLRGRRIWSESSGIVRLTREDARSDGEWMRDLQERAGKDSLNKIIEGRND